MKDLLSALPPLVMAAGAAVALELRRLTEIQAVVAEERSSASAARAAARGVQGS